MSPSHVQKLRTVMSGIFALAVRTKRVPSNPCEGLELPRVRERRRKYLTATQVHELAQAASTLPAGRPHRVTDAAFAQYRLPASWCSLWGTAGCVGARGLLSVWLTAVVSVQAAVAV